VVGASESQPALVLADSSPRTLARQASRDRFASVKRLKFSCKQLSAAILSYTACSKVQGAAASRVRVTSSRSLRSGSDIG
jgi:hypothetical protein